MDTLRAQCKGSVAVANGSKNKLELLTDEEINVIVMVYDLPIDRKSLTVLEGVDILCGDVGVVGNTKLELAV